MKIVYWIATLWASLGMLSTAMTQVFKVKPKWDFITHLGYPDYFMTIIGIWKILGVIAILIPRFPLLKEWAYAGFFFVMSGAIFSHIAMGDSIKEMFPAIFLFLLILVSWYFRPASRKIALNRYA